MIYQSDLYYCMLLSYFRNEEFRSILHLRLRNTPTTTTTTAPAASAAAATTSVADIELDEPPAPKRPHLRTGRGAPGIGRKRVSLRQKRRRKQRGIRPPTPTTQNHRRSHHRHQLNRR